MGHSPFCMSLLLSGHIFPQRFPVQTELSVKEATEQANVRTMRHPPGHKNKTFRMANLAEEQHLPAVLSQHLGKTLPVTPARKQTNLS